MPRRARFGLAFGLVSLLAVPAAAQPASAPAAVPEPGLQAGVAVVDATWHVGASAGQYTAERYGIGEGILEGEPPDLTGPIEGDADPHLHATKETPSYGVQSRLTIRAIVVEGSNG